MRLVKKWKNPQRARKMKLLGAHSIRFALSLSLAAFFFFLFLAGERARERARRKKWGKYPSATPLLTYITQCLVARRGVSRARNCWLKSAQVVVNESFLTPCSPQCQGWGYFIHQCHDEFKLICICSSFRRWNISISVPHWRREVLFSIFSQVIKGFRFYSASSLSTFKN